MFTLLRQLPDNDSANLTWRTHDGGQPPIVAVLSEKGGVGKTGMVNGLAAVAAEGGLNVLVIDLDPRATATDELGIADPSYSVNDLLYINPEDEDPADITGAAGDAILPAGQGWPDSVHVLAAERALGNRETDLTPGLEFRLKYSLTNVANQYDLVLIDVPPRPGGKLVGAGMIAATHILIPATLDEDGYVGARDAMRTVRTLRPHNPDVRMVGIVRNIVDRRRTSLAEMYDTKLHDLRYLDETRDLVLADAAVAAYTVRREARSASVPFTTATTPEVDMLRRGYTQVLNYVGSAA